VSAKIWEERRQWKRFCIAMHRIQKGLSTMEKITIDGKPFAVVGDRDPIFPYITGRF
jgi:hypothetical protein